VSIQSLFLARSEFDLTIDHFRGLVGCRSTHLIEAWMMTYDVDSVPLMIDQYHSKGTLLAVSILGFDVFCSGYYFDSCIFPTIIIRPSHFTVNGTPA
jgi:hypothetical protein